MNETDNENFLNQLDAVKTDYNYFVRLNDRLKDTRDTRQMLESLIVLQQYLSKVTTDVYKEYDKKLKEQLDLVNKLNL